MEDLPFSPTSAAVAELEGWNWTSGQGAALAQQLLGAVAAAESVSEGLEVEPVMPDASMAETRRLRMAHWQPAMAIAEQLRNVEPGPHPPSVQEALDRTEVAVSRLGLTAVGDHDLR